MGTKFSIFAKEGPTPTPRTELLLYEASRSQHVDQVIRPYLQKNYWCFVIDLQPVPSLWRPRISEEWVEKLNDCHGQFATDLTILLDLSVEEPTPPFSQGVLGWWKSGSNGI